MDGTAITKILEVAEPHLIRENGHTYTDKQLSVIAKPNVDSIELKTLSSLITLIEVEKTAFLAPILIHVVSPTTVEIICGINSEDRSREKPYTVTSETAAFRFGYWYSYEEMMIALKSKFVETDELLKLVQLLGTITEENNAIIADDGFTQTVTVRKGIAMKDNKAVNPRVKLCPYCTFNEIEQPEREFLLRLNGNGEAALFEADGGAWKLEARKRIATYLREMLTKADFFEDKYYVYVIE